MRSPRLCSLLCLFAALGPTTLHAQYSAERVLEKSFEQTDFFFTSNPLTPFGIGSFRQVSASLFQDPLSRLAVNPAFFSLDTLKDHYAYLDFRSVSDIREQASYASYAYPMNDYRIATDYIAMPYPRFYLDTRKDLQPVIAAAYLTRPLSSILPHLLAGATYQAVFQDDKYYPIPQDIYRSVIGYDYAGTKVSAENLPVVDLYKGSDDIHHLAHMISFYAAYEVSKNLHFGLKLGRTLFNRDGSNGSQNLWDGYYNPTYQSMWGNSESREQQYRDWDLSAGLRYRLAERDELGLTLGRLWGTADQGLMRTDTSLYGSGTVGAGTNWSYYMRSGATNQSWDHSGRTTYGSIQLNRSLSPSLRLDLLYGFTAQKVDIGLASSISDTSFSSYRYQYNDTLVSRSDGYYRLLDTRSGVGNKASNSHRFFASLLWRASDRASVSVGLQLEFQSSETNTDEGVVARRQSQYSSSYGTSYNYSSFDKTTENKHLLWTFTTDVTTVQVPVVLHWQATDWIEALVGISRIMSSWEVNDVTLAVIQLRDRQGTWGGERKENFGERYTMPKERVSDIRTSGLFGLTARPSGLFAIRLLVTPNVVNEYDGTHVQDWRWWLSFQLTP
ncbi:MAG: hypothetical protein Q8P51_10205 [Ignavibacteria bacterium]|nr:hypothetical protein [Ignavibacteria bacterium]